MDPTHAPCLNDAENPAGDLGHTHPTRPPGLLAKVVSTLDHISNGRTVLGVGAGVTQRMFDAYSTWDPPNVRVSKTKEGIELILKLWNEKKVDFHGKYYSAKGAVLEPKPVQRPNPPLLFGGSGARMLRLAGQYADMCYIPPWNKMDLYKARAIVTAEARRFNRQNRVSFVYAHTPLGPTEHYDRKEYGMKVEEASKIGFDYFITAFSMDAAPWDRRASSESVITNYLECLRDFASSLIPSYGE